jgi:hypothetical protein
MGMRIIFLVHLYIVYLCRNMEGDTEWNKLMAWGDALEPTTTDPRDGANQDDDVAMQILDEPDEEDGEEIQILTPPSAMPSTGSSTSTPAGPEQVNTIFNTVPTSSTGTDTDFPDPYLNQNILFKGTDDSGSAGQASAGRESESVIPMNTGSDPDVKENEDEKSSRSSDFTYQSINTSYSKHGIKRSKGKVRGIMRQSVLNLRNPTCPPRTIKTNQQE